MLQPTRRRMTSVFASPAETECSCSPSTGMAVDITATIDLVGLDGIPFSTSSGA